MVDVGSVWQIIGLKMYQGINFSNIMPLHILHTAVNAIVVVGT